MNTLYFLPDEQLCSIVGGKDSKKRTKKVTKKHSTKKHFTGRVVKSGPKPPTKKVSDRRTVRVTRRRSR